VIDDVVVVHHRVDDRDLTLAIVARETEIVERTDIEIAAVADAGQIEARDPFGGDGQPFEVGLVSREARGVIRQVKFVGEQQRVPAPDPFLV